MEDMNVSLGNIAIVGAVERNGMGLDVIITWCVGEVMGIVKYFGLSGNGARAIAEIIDLVHV
jgi:hypothetical protein